MYLNRNKFTSALQLLLVFLLFVVVAFAMEGLGGLTWVLCHFGICFHVHAVVDRKVDDHSQQIVSFDEGLTLETSAF